MCCDSLGLSLCVCLCWLFRRGRNSRPCSGKHQVKTFGFFVVLEWEEWDLTGVCTLPYSLEYKTQPAGGHVSRSTLRFLLLFTGNTNRCAVMNQLPKTCFILCISPCCALTPTSTQQTAGQFISTLYDKQIAVDDLGWGQFFPGLVVCKQL